jgi:hypothetical protein
MILILGVSLAHELINVNGFSYTRILFCPVIECINTLCTLAGGVGWVILLVKKPLMNPLLKFQRLKLEKKWD